jgi:hypothetical protein
MEKTFTKVDRFARRTLDIRALFEALSGSKCLPDHLASVMADIFNPEPVDPFVRELETI